jgi:hypothetical protein
MMHSWALPLSLLSLAAAVPVGVALGSLVGTVLGGPARGRDATRSHEDVDDALVDRLVAEMLIEELGLRREYRHAIVAEVRRERPLVLAWLKRRAPP